MFLLWLCTRWFLDLFDLIQSEGPTGLSKVVCLPLKNAVLLIRYTAIAYVLAGWLGGGSSSLLVLIRLFFSVALYLWSVRFWRCAEKRGWFPPATGASRGPAVIAGVRASNYLVLAAGFVMEMAGYGALSLYWYLSWGKTGIAALWSGLLFLFFRSLKEAGRIQPEETVEEEAPRAFPLRWALLRLAFLGWFAGTVVALVYAWGESSLFCQACTTG